MWTKDFHDAGCRAMKDSDPWDWGWGQDKVSPSWLLGEFPGLALGRETQAQSGILAELGRHCWGSEEIKAARICKTE